MTDLNAILVTRGVNLKIFPETLFFPKEMQQQTPLEMNEKMEEQRAHTLKLYELRLLRCSLTSYSAAEHGPKESADLALSSWDASIDTVVNLIEKGMYAEALHSEPARLVFGCTDCKYENTKEYAENFYRGLEHRITAFLRGKGSGVRSAVDGDGDAGSWLDFVGFEDDLELQFRALLAMALGVAAFSVFVQCNMTGPCTDFPRFPFYHHWKQENITSKEGTEWDIWAYQQLMSDGCDLLGKYLFPQYFILAKLVLLKTRDMTSKNNDNNRIGPKSISWWLSRLLLVQQRVLDERSCSLYELLKVSMEETLKHFGQSSSVVEYWEKLDGREVSIIVAAANLEAGIKEHVYGHVDRARQYFKSAEAACSFQLSVTGALGFRTTHQVEAKAQMVLVAASLGDQGEESSKKSQSDDSLVHSNWKIHQGYDGTEHPHETYVGSDILLAPRLIDDMTDGGIPTVVGDIDRSSPKVFSTIEQAVILAQCLDIKRSTPHDEMQDWQMAPFIEAVDAQKLSHIMVRCFCQILRIRWECKRSRTKQRALLMMDELVQGVRGGSMGVADRMHYAYCVYFPTIPALLKECAELMVSCGIIGDALRIFEELELWDNLIYCYCLLGKKAAATDLIKERLNHNPENPRLWCSLGDVTLNDDYYIKALEVSGNRFARAERSLARSAYNRGEYKKSLSHWESALSLNSLHPDGWFALGSAALKAKDFDKAIDGFTHAIQLDPDNGEAWNNIACLHMRKKRNKEAFVAFKEALKFRRNSWQMWDNYSQVAMDIGNFGQALEATKMVLDLTDGKRVDLSFLSKLVEEMESRKISFGCLPVATHGTIGKFIFNDSVIQNELSETVTGQCGKKSNGTMDAGSLHKESYGGVNYSWETQQLVDLIGKILQKMVRCGEGGGDVWGLYARWHKFKGDLTMCSEALLKQVRAYQGSDLKHNEDHFKKFARASVQLCEVYIDIASSSDSKRELATAQMHLKNAIKQAENFSGTDEYKALEVCLEQVQQQLHATFGEKPE